MTTTLNNIKSEFFKLISKKKYIVLLVLSAAVCFLRFGGSVLVERVSGGVINIKSNMMLELLPLLAEIIVPLVLFMSVTDLFASEIQDDSLKAILIRPISRFKVMTSKIFAAFLMGILYFGVIFIVCAFIQILSGNSFLPVLLPSALAYLIDLIPLFGIVLMGTLINMLVSSPTLAMLLSIGIYALMKYANIFIAPFGQTLFTAYLGWHKLWIGTILPIHALISNILVVFATMLIFYALSYILFDRKEF